MFFSVSHDNIYNSNNRTVSASLQVFNISYKQNGKIQQLCTVLGLFVGLRGLNGILKICLVPFLNIFTKKPLGIEAAEIMKVILLLVTERRGKNIPLPVSH